MYVHILALDLLLKICNISKFGLENIMKSDLRKYGHLRAKHSIQQVRKIANKENQWK